MATRELVKFGEDIIKPRPTNMTLKDLDKKTQQGMKDLEKKIGIK